MPAAAQGRGSRNKVWGVRGQKFHILFVWIPECWGLVIHLSTSSKTAIALPCDVILISDPPKDTNPPSFVTHQGNLLFMVTDEHLICPMCYRSTLSKDVHRGFPFCIKDRPPCGTIKLPLVPLGPLWVTLPPSQMPEFFFCSYWGTPWFVQCCDTALVSHRFCSAIRAENRLHSVCSGQYSTTPS